MAHYLVSARAKNGALRRVRQLLDEGVIASMRPFGQALNFSLRTMRYDLRGNLVWEEEDYCIPPLAMERETVLDKYFDIVSIEPVNRGEGWSKLSFYPSVWTIFSGLPERRGEKPLTRKGMPHQQLTQNSDAKTYRSLAELLFSLPGVREEMSAVSVPGARALVLDEKEPPGPSDAFMAGREFAHLHPPGDGSLHLMAPPNWVDEIIGKGWGEKHPAAGLLIPENALMIYAPKNEAEATTVYEIVLLSYWRAKGLEVPGPRSLG